MPALPRAADVPELNGDELRARVARDEVVFWLGAGISLWRPTSLPSGPALRDWFLTQMLEDVPLLAALKAQLSDSTSRLGRTTRSIAPEPVGSSFHEGVGERFLDPWLGPLASARPNEVHRSIARAAARSHVVTTNFDLCLEAAGVSHERVIDVSDIPAHVDDPLLVKIHGCVSRPSSIVPFITRFNSHLDPKLVDLLARIVEHRTIVFAGYSAGDFDLLPILDTVHVSSVVFVIRHADDLDLNVQQRALLARHGGSRITGMERFVSALNAAPPPSLGHPDLQTVAGVVATDAERITATAHLLRAVNLCDDAIQLLGHAPIDSFPAQLRTSTLRSLAFCYREINDFESDLRITNALAARGAIDRKEHLKTLIAVAILRHDFASASDLVAELQRLPLSAVEQLDAEFHLARIHMHLVALGAAQLDDTFIARVMRELREAALRSGNLDAVLSSDRFDARRTRLRISARNAPPSPAEIDELDAHIAILQRARFWWQSLGRLQGTINTLREIAMLQHAAGYVAEAYDTFAAALEAQGVTGGSRYDFIKITWWLRRLASDLGRDGLAADHDRSLAGFLASQDRRLVAQWQPLLRDLDRSAGLVG